VVAFHAKLPVPGGFVGVDVFFVISGFVITAMLQRERAATGRVRFGRFYLRRFQRLTPALALVVGVTVIAAALVLSPFAEQKDTAKAGIGAMLLLANVVIAGTTGGYFDTPAASNALLNTWSLSVEEQFYLAFPLILAAAWVLARRRRLRLAPFAVVGAVALISFGIALLDITTASMTSFYNPLARAWEFAVGALLALVVAARPIWSPVAASLMGALGAVAVTASLFLISENTEFPGTWTLLPVAGTLLLLLAGSCAENPVSRLLATTPFARIGDWSYSIYLWHWPFIVIAIALWPGNVQVIYAAALASLLPALASYRWVEQPIRRLRLGRQKMVRLVAVTLAIPLALAGALGFAAQNVFWIPDSNGLYAAVRTGHASDGCDLKGFSPERCTWNHESTGRPIYLVGDSTAWHFTEAAIGAAEQLDRPVSVLQLYGCPFKDVYVDRPTAPPREMHDCRDGYEAMMRFLAGSPDGLVMISELNGLFRPSTTAVGRTTTEFTTDARERTKVLEAGLRTTIAELQDAGHSTLLVQAAPDFAVQAFSPASCSVLQLARKRCHAQMTLAEADALQGAERRSVERVVATTRSAVWDPRAFFCPAGTCVTQIPGASLYRDGFHISAQASAMLAPDLARAVATAG
jgi:peptidoglycan/LPS O-acetylase OafA/YrhL